MDPSPYLNEQVQTPAKQDGILGVTPAPAGATGDTAPLLPTDTQGGVTNAPNEAEAKEVHESCFIYWRSIGEETRPILKSEAISYQDQVPFTYQPITTYQHSLVVLSNKEENKLQIGRANYYRTAEDKKQETEGDMA